MGAPSITTSHPGLSLRRARQPPAPRLAPLCLSLSVRPSLAGSASASVSLSEFLCVFLLVFLSELPHCCYLLDSNLIPLGVEIPLQHRPPRSPPHQAVSEGVPISLPEAQLVVDRLQAHTAPLHHHLCPRHTPWPVISPSSPLIPPF